MILLKHAAAGLLILACAMPCVASAQNFPNTQDMTCAEAKALVASKGGLDLATGPNTFNRYVKDVAFCAEGQNTKEAWVPTKDVPQCVIGSTCVDGRGR